VDQSSSAPRVRPMRSLRHLHQSRQKSLNRSAPTPYTIILARHLETVPDIALPPPAPVIAPSPRCWRPACASTASGATPTRVGIPPRRGRGQLCAIMAFQRLAVRPAPSAAMRRDRASSAHFPKCASRLMTCRFGTPQKPSSDGHGVSRCSRHTRNSGTRWSTSAVLHSLPPDSAQRRCCRRLRTGA
jgi:hypothetical protein